MGIFATGVAASTLVILAYDRPFTGELSIRPDLLLQVMPEIGKNAEGSHFVAFATVAVSLTGSRAMASSAWRKNAAA
jgi:hypothetical protein